MKDRSLTFQHFYLHHAVHVVGVAHLLLDVVSRELAPDRPLARGVGRGRREHVKLCKMLYELLQDRGEQVGIRGDAVDGEGLCSRGQVLVGAEAALEHPGGEGGVLLLVQRGRAARQARDQHRELYEVRAPVDSLAGNPVKSVPKYIHYTQATFTVHM